MLYVKFITGCLATALLLGSCTKETEQKGTDPVTPDADNSRREVLMTLKNKLSVKPVTSKAGTPIATAAENAISTLDVYVFGATQESGDYTFQERFAYRADANDKLPQGATELQLNTTDADGYETSGLLKLKKGLFVKLYCIANDTTLTTPATGKTIVPADFTPITFTEGENGNPQPTTEGTPLESTFLTWHTRLLTATAKADTLATPLAMAGAYTTPVDLTGFDNSARLQIGFKLTRLAARFDIDNKAGVSRFTIETVSMGNGRRGSGYFPIRVYGDLPEAQPDQLITYPVHAFYGEDANNGLQTGAFYAYPSPKDDKAYMILKGKYKVNETEMKDVSYQIPFTQQMSDGNATWFDIANNHRYTISITKAAPYHLDANISVADWADDGTFEYTPEDSNNELLISTPPAFEGLNKYDKNTQTVSMALETGSTFDMSINTTSALSFKKTYTGGLNAQQYDWLKISETTTGLSSKAIQTNYTYTFELQKDYNKSQYPRAIVRFSNTMTGAETVLFVEAIAAPQAISIQQEAGNRNTIDTDLLKASMYRVNGSKLKIKMLCFDGITMTETPEWLDVKPVSTNATETVYQFTLKNDYRDTAEQEGTVSFCNSKHMKLKTTITVKLSDATIAPDFSALGGTDNTYTPPSDDTPGKVNMTICSKNNFTIKTLSLDGVQIGVDFNGGPEWLSHNGVTMTKAGTHPNTILFSLVESKIAQGQARTATVTLKNKSGGKDYSFAVIPIFKEPVVEKSNTPGKPIQNSLSNTSLTIYKVPGSTIEIKAYALGGSEIQNKTTGITVTGGNNYTADNIYTVTWDGTNTNAASFDIVNKSDPENKKTTMTVNLLSPEITASNTLITAGNNSNSNISIQSPEGIKVAVLDNNWNGGGEWFTISNTDLAKGNQNIVIKQPDNTNTIMKAVTLRLTNNIEGGAAKDITVTPGNFTAPVLSATSGNYLWAKNNVYIPKRSSATAITITKLAGGVGNITSSNPSVATVSVDGTTLTITPKAIGSSTISVLNASDTEKKATFNVTVSAANLYNGQQVWYFGDLIIAPALANNSQALTPWNKSVLDTACPSGWHIPTSTEWDRVKSTNNYTTYNNAFPEGKVGNYTQYWGNSENGSKAYIFYLRHKDSMVLGSFFGKTEANVYVRCCATP